MTLTGAMDSARSGLSVAAGLIHVVSRNVSNQANANATRKIANVATDGAGNARLASIRNALSPALLASLLSASSDLGQQSAIASALSRLDASVGDPQDDASPAAKISKLNAALQAYAAAPQNDGAALAALGAAREVAKTLNQASSLIASVRADADAEIAATVKEMNALLGQFHKVNAAIVAGSLASADVTDQIDARNGLLEQLSAAVGIRTVDRANNDVAIYTDSGVTLFDRTPREVSFRATFAFGPATAGEPVYVDGVPITAQGSALSAHSGKLLGLAAVRDSLAVTYQNQLDEIARGLIAAFAEKDQVSAVPGPDQAGLFTYSGAPLTSAGGPVVPAPGVLHPGLAAAITIAAGVDPAQGGDINRLRDGGISGPNYVYNKLDAAGYTARLNDLSAQILAGQTFSPAGQIAPSGNLLDFASSSVAWLQEQRQAALSASSYRATLHQAAASAFSNETGINLDEELTQLIALEQSYQASSKLISTVSSLYQSLFNAVQP